MVNESNNKFTWVIKNFSFLQCDIIYSEEFVIGGCKWRLMAFPKGNNTANHLSLFLSVANAKYLSFGWKRHAKFSFTVVNQISEQLSLVIELKEHWFDQKISDWGIARVIDLGKLKSKRGFLVNNEVKIVVEIDVLQVISKLDVPEAETQPLKKIKLEERIYVYGLHVLPSQVKFVSRVFKKYPDIAAQLRAKKEPLRSSCLSVFLGLIETLCKSLQELSNDSLVEADNSLNYLKCSGIKVDWFEKKVEEVKENKKEERIGVARTQEVEETLKIFKQKYSDKEALLEKEKVEVKDLKQKCSDMEALMEKEKVELKDLKQKCAVIEVLLEKEKAKLLAARAPPLTLDDD
ncbi:hypothetical protein AALP_AA5G227000 [Arabis alpina]|uniref:MATH domain-containing protein n=1 Tax=Arabis alpina TaxID=50452 RepID=A0A087GYU2_ARAAL|nr:hypothetical protein AALP_AA5G227000 [Arabis alpina]